MNPKAKKVIIGVAKTTGKYTLKGLGKGVELATRGGLKTVDALVKSPAIQKLGTAALMVTACVTCPPIALAAVSGLGVKAILNQGLGNRRTSIMDEISGLLNIGTKVTKGACDKILSPICKTAEKEMKDVGKNFQAAVDGWFK